MMVKPLLLALISTPLAALASPVSPSNVLLSNNGPSAALSGCDQGNCPDHDAYFDLWSIATNNGYWVYDLRFRDDERCSRGEVSEDACDDFTYNGFEVNVCFDWRKDRGHVIYKDLGIRICHHMASEYTCGGRYWVGWFDREVACTW